MITHFLSLLLLLTIACTLPAQNPVIGIYTQYAPNSLNISRTYIAASYIKYLDMSGAQVVPVFYNTTEDNLLKLLSQINGVLFPGGDAEIDISNKWTANANYIFEYAKAQNDQGRVFPLWGTCLGHELLSYLTAGYDQNVLERVDG
jgi:gamma-glutamyl hydrolase